MFPAQRQVKANDQRIVRPARLQPRREVLPHLPFVATPLLEFFRESQAQRVDQPALSRRVGQMAFQKEEIYRQGR